MQIRRWRRYGKDRLYVKDDEGRDLGWYDVVDRTTHPATPEAECALADAAAIHLAGCSAPGGERAEPPKVSRSAPDPELAPDSLPEPPGPIEALPAAHSWPADPPLAPVSFPPPQGPPVTDLLSNLPGQQLAGKVAEARAAGEVPTFWRRLAHGKNAYSTWERGAIGERLVAEELDKLCRADHYWGYLNSIPVGEQTDIDLFVAGPGGLFTVNAKYHRGARIWVGGDTVYVNGTRQPYVRNSRHEARKASRLLTRATGTATNVQGKR